MKYIVPFKFRKGDVNFEYNRGLVIGQVWIHDFFFDVYRKTVDLNSEEDFKNCCQKAYDEEIPDNWKGILN